MRSIEISSDPIIDLTEISSSAIPSDLSLDNFNYWDEDKIACEYCLEYEKDCKCTCFNTSHIDFSHYVLHNDRIINSDDNFLIISVNFKTIYN